MEVNVLPSPTRPGRRASGRGLRVPLLSICLTLALVHLLTPLVTTAVAQSATARPSTEASLAAINGAAEDDAHISFEQVPLANTSGRPYTGLALGPDGRLYAGTLRGEIVRFQLNADGTTAEAEVISSLQTAAGEERALIGLTFDPSATATDLILWVSHSAPGRSGVSGVHGAPDWSGRISRLSGPGLEAVQDFVVQLPRSDWDHMTNGLAFHDGALYIAQGSNSPMGLPSELWGQRPERLLSAAILRLDPQLVSSPPLDVKTEDGGAYDPFAPGAPLTIHASGVRNAYDLVFHSNGELYVPVNGSGGGWSTPTTPESLPESCRRRLDNAINGDYDGPAVVGLEKVGEQSDYLLRIVPGGYYGHANPLRCEWVMGGGNPTAGVDPGEIAGSGSWQGYPVGTQPDRNWRGFLFDLGQSSAPTGMIEYHFDNPLKGKLLVTRFASGRDIVALRPGGPEDPILGVQTEIPGFTGFRGAVDLVEDPASGSLYVAELGGRRITLLRPLIPTETATDTARFAMTDTPELDIVPQEVVFSSVRGRSSVARAVLVTNTGSASAVIAEARLDGPHSEAFQLPDQPVTPLSLEPGGSATFSVVFNPPRQAVGTLSAALRLVTGEAQSGDVRVDLYGLSTRGEQGLNEPPLKQVLETLGFPIDPGGESLTLGTESSPIGEEVPVPLFRKAGDGPVRLRPVARFSPDESVPFGFYANEPDGPLRRQVAAIARGQEQTLYPSIEPGGEEAFEPGDTAFGIYVESNSFGRASYTEDRLNTGPTAHAARVYPLRNRGGQPLANTYLVAFEDARNGDYQDYVFVLANAQPASPGLGSRLVGQSANPWRSAAPAPIGRFEAASAVIDGKLYVFGGFYNAETQATVRSDVYDPMADSWSQIADLPIPVTHAGQAVDGEFVYLAGGFVGDHPGPQTDQVWRYHAPSNSWSAGPSLPAARGGGAMVRLERELHFFGGTTRDARGRYIEDPPDHWILNLDGDEGWRLAAPLPNPRNHLSGVALNGRIYAIGGQHLGQEKPGNQVSVHAYDPAADAWNGVANLPLPLGHILASSFTWGERIVVVAGVTQGGRKVANVLLYDPQTDTWSELPSLPGPRQSPVAAIIGNDMIVTGGRPRTSPETQTWIASLDALTPQAGLRSTLATAQLASSLLGQRGGP